MPTKTYAVLVKTAANDTTMPEGEFTALASVFNNVDAVHDVVMPGAFADNLKAWSASGNPIPVLWGHQTTDPNMNIGAVLEAAETDAGLQVKCQLDLENPTAAQVYRLMKGRRVNKMSFSYDIDDAAPAERDGQPVYELRKLKLHEVSVVQIPANPAAVIQSVKAAADRCRAKLGEAPTLADPAVVDLLSQAGEALDNAADIATGKGRTDTSGVKAGRTLSAKNEQTLRAALDQIAAGMADVKTVLDSLESKTHHPDDGKDDQANPSTPVSAEEPDGAKAEPARPGPASLRLRIGLGQIADEIPTLTD